VIDDTGLLIIHSSNTD